MAVSGEEGSSSTREASRAQGVQTSPLMTMVKSMSLERNALSSLVLPMPMPRVMK